MCSQKHCKGVKEADWAERDVELRCHCVSEAEMVFQRCPNLRQGAEVCPQAMTTHWIWAALRRGHN